MTDDPLTRAIAEAAARRRGTTVREAVRQYDAPTHAEGMIRVEHWDGKRCIVLRTAATPYPSRPVALRPIGDGETPANARDAFVRSLCEGGSDIVVLDSERDDVTITGDMLAEEANP